jgi:hypothetical protein
VIALDHDFHPVCERVGSAGGSAIKRLVDEPLVLLESLQTVASKLGQGLGKVWAAVCSEGGSAIKRLVDEPLVLLAFLLNVT